MRVFGLKTCDTCRKATKRLPDATFVDVRTEGLPDDVPDDALDALGDALLNTRSTTWRGLSDDDRARPVRDLLKAHPALMKRPLIEVNGRFLLGWGADTQSALGLD